MFDAHAQKNILIVRLQIFDNLFHYKNTVTVQWNKRLKLCMVTMATLPPAKELKIQVVSWQNEIRTLDVLKSPTCFFCTIKISYSNANRRQVQQNYKHAVCCSITILKHPSIYQNNHSHVLVIISVKITIMKFF